VSVGVTKVCVGVVGLGTIGRQELDLWHSGGFATVGYDVSVNIVQTVDAAYSGLERAPLLTSTADAIRDCDLIVLCLPTAGSNGEISVRAFDEFVDVRRSGRWRVDQLTIVASTVPIGFSRVLASRIGVNRLAHAPERFDPGRPLALGTIPRVVGGLTDEARDAAITYYRRVGVVASATNSLEVAEASKLFENAFRLVNIALANEFAALCQRIGISTGDVIEAAASKPFGFMPHYPGPGAGGMCIPVVPRFLVEAARGLDTEMPILEAAIQSNDGRPDLVVLWIDEILRGRPSATRVVVVGATYKANYPDTRGSTALKLINKLARRYETAVYDPVVSSSDLPSGVTLHRTVPGEHYDLVVIAVPHASIDLENIGDLAPLVMDLTRGETRGVAASSAERSSKVGVRQ
jgi:UDP-N-acetyl-D-glucosamine dehydrogenase